MLSYAGEEVFVLGRVDVSKPHVTLGMEEGELSNFCTRKEEVLSVLLASPHHPTADPGSCWWEAE